MSSFCKIKFSCSGELFFAWILRNREKLQDYILEIFETLYTSLFSAKRFRNIVILKRGSFWRFSAVILDGNEERRISFFLLVFCCSKGLRRLFASLSSVSLHQWKVYEPLMFQRGLWGRKREKVTEVSPQRWPKSWCLQKSVRNSNFSGVSDRFRLPHQHQQRYVDIELRKC